MLKFRSGLGEDVLSTFFDFLGCGNIKFCIGFIRFSAVDQTPSRNSEITNGFGSFVTFRGKVPERINKRQVL